MNTQVNYTFVFGSFLRSFETLFADNDFTYTDKQSFLKNIIDTVDDNANKLCKYISISKRYVVICCT